MKITIISDTHNRHGEVEGVDGGDMIIHCGDIMGSGRNPNEMIDFLDWFSHLNYKHKVFIAGNHDRLLQDNKKWVDSIHDEADSRGITYLRDETVIIEGLKLYGMPWQPEFFDWAFNLPRDGQLLQEKVNFIPHNVNILITHGPPAGILDTSGPPWNTPMIGCSMLLDKVVTVKPHIHCFGHVHGSYGAVSKRGVEFINASSVNENYAPVNPAINIELDRDTKKIKYL